MNDRSRTPRHAEAGYTLLEVLVAIGILAAMASAVVAFWPGRFDERLDVVAERIRLSLVAAREAAMRTGEPSRIEFNLGKRTWSNLDGRESELPVKTDVEVTAAKAASQTQRLGITFMPQGSSTGGRITLADETARVEITVDWLTSRIAVARSDD